MSPSTRCLRIGTSCFHLVARSMRPTDSQEAVPTNLILSVCNTSCQQVCYIHCETGNIQCETLPDIGLTTTLLQLVCRSVTGFYVCSQGSRSTVNQALRVMGVLLAQWLVHACLSHLRVAFHSCSVQLSHNTSSLTEYENSSWVFS